MPEVHGLAGSPALESTGVLLSAPTQSMLAVLYTKHDLCHNIKRSALHV